VNETRKRSCRRIHKIGCTLPKKKETYRYVNMQMIEFFFPSAFFDFVKKKCQGCQQTKLAGNFVPTQVCRDKKMQFILPFFAASQQSWLAGWQSQGQGCFIFFEEKKRKPYLVCLPAKKTVPDLFFKFFKGKKCKSENTEEKSFLEK
jgi:hypothetical protein